MGGTKTKTMEGGFLPDSAYGTQNSALGPVSCRYARSRVLSGHGKYAYQGAYKRRLIEVSGLCEPFFNRVQNL